MVTPAPSPCLGLIPERLSAEGGRLGRHLHFDPRSRAYGVRLPRGVKVVTRLWGRTTPAFDQGNLGSCTGNGAAGLLCTAPFRPKGLRGTETLARKIYSEATRLDAIVGAWPPDDTGSSVLAAMKALKALGYAKAYTWCFSLDQVLKTLSALGPVEVGVPWYEGFDRPDAQGRVTLAGAVRGGHAFELLGVDAEARRVLAINSWGPQWGLEGRFSIAWKDLDRLLHEHGEAATLTR